MKNLCRVCASIADGQSVCPRRCLAPSASFNNASGVSRTHCVTPCALERPSKRVPRASPTPGASTNDREFPRSAVRSLKAGNDVDRKEEKTGTALMDGGGGLIQRVRRQRSDTPRTDHARI